MLILGAVLLLIAAVLTVKYTLPGAESGSRSAQEKLDDLMSEGKPVMVFFYSDACRSCQELKAVMNEVYPDFQNSVALVEVNVYEEENQELVEQTGVQITPTTLFIDASGHKLLVPETMTAEELRARLAVLAGGQP